MEEEISALLNDTYKSKREYNSLKRAIDSMPDFKFCPIGDCGGGGLVIGNLSWVVCLRCLRKFCPTCQEEFHFGFTCEKRRQWKMENESGYLKTKKWFEEKTKACPNCKVNIERDSGCPHMTCANCRHQFCWTCMEPYTNGHIREKHWLPEREARLRAEKENISRTVRAVGYSIKKRKAESETSRKSKQPKPTSLA
jgi:ariadne-1